MKEKEDILDEGQIYEIGFHILPNVPEEKLPEEVLRLKDSITVNDGVVIADEFPKMVILSYDIKKRVETKYLNFNKAYFGWIKFEAARSSLDKIEKEVKNNQNVLRFIIVKTVRENTMHTPKIPMMARVNNTEERKAPKIESVPVEKTEVSEAEIDKSIDELLIGEN